VHHGRNQQTLKIRTKCTTWWYKRGIQKFLAIIWSEKVIRVEDTIDYSRIQLLSCSLVTNPQKLRVTLVIPERGQLITCAQLINLFSSTSTYSEFFNIVNKTLYLCAQENLLVRKLLFSLQVKEVQINTITGCGWAAHSIRLIGEATRHYHLITLHRVRKQSCSL